MKTFVPPVTGNTVTSCVITHMGALCYVSTTGGGYISTDVGATWRQVPVAGSLVATAQGIGGSLYSLGSPLFQY